MSRPEMRYFVHFISELLPVIAVIHGQVDVLQLQLEGAGDAVHQGNGHTHNSTFYKTNVNILILIG